MVIAIFGILLLLAFLPRIIEALGALQNQDTSQEEKEKELERQQKGALVNTVDFVFGEETTEKLADAINPKPKFETDLEKLEDAATETFGTKVTFDPSTTVTKEGIIEATSPPTADISSLLTTQEILAFQNKVQSNTRRFGTVVIS